MYEDDNRGIEYARGWARFASSDQSRGLGCTPTSSTVILFVIFFIIAFIYHVLS